MIWNKLTDITQLDIIDKESELLPIMIFKHSTRCSTSGAALGRIERNWNEDKTAIIKPYFLDLIASRNISNEIENRYHIRHESPQVLVIYKGKCIFSQTHLGINLAEILNAKE